MAGRESVPASRRSASRAGPRVLRLDADIYTEEALERTRRAFAHLAAIDLRREGKRWTVRFARVDPAVADRLPGEFANYALSCRVVGS